MIRVGLIGAGFIGRNHFNQYEKLADRARVVALCDQQADRRAGDWSNVGGNIGDARGTRRDLSAIKPYTDFDAIVADPDVDLIDICVPTYLHPEIATAALAAGKHVLCEKPMALSVELCDEMLHTARSGPSKFMIAQCIRFWPEYAYLKDAVADGRFGALKALHLRRQASTPDYSLNNWIVDPNLSGGAVLDLHVHDVDYALYLLGKPRAVSAQGYVCRHNSIDRIHASWHYDRDVVVQVEGFWDMPKAFGFNMGFTAVFDNAAVVWDLCTGKPLTVYPQDGEPDEPELPAGGDGYFREIDYFVGCIERNEEPAISTPEQSRDAVAIALAEKQSAISKERVALA